MTLGQNRLGKDGREETGKFQGNQGKVKMPPHTCGGLKRFPDLSNVNKPQVTASPSSGARALW